MFFAAFVAIFLLVPSMTFGANYTVTVDDGDGAYDGSESCLSANVVGAGGDNSNTDCSLREAIVISESNGTDDVITLPAGTYTISSGVGDLVGDYNIDTGDLLEIRGASAATTIIDVDATGRGFDVDNGAALSLSDLTIQNGELTGEDGAGIRVRSSGTLTLDTVTITSNTVHDDEGGSGGGIYCGSSTLNISDSTFASNTGDGVSGGAIYATSCDVDISSSTFSSNSGYNGGALRLYVGNSDDVSITDTTFESNAASNVGGAIGLFGTTDSNRTVMSEVLFSGNTSAGSGSGALHLEGPSYITNGTFYNNRAQGNGGAILIYSFVYSDTTIAHSTFVGNQSDSDTSGAGDGGAVYVLGTNPDVNIVSSIFDGNTANGNSGPECYGAASDTIDLLSRSLMSTNGGCSTVVTSAAGSAFGTDPLTDPDGPADNGGTVETIALEASSPAIDDTGAACNDAEGNPLTVDGRGMTRPEDTYCDIGAYEVDQTDPVLTVSGSSATVECGAAYTDAGASATDNFGLNGAVSTTNPVDVDAPDLYTVSYVATDYDGNQDTGSRTVTVQDTTAPSITLIGDSEETVTVGDTYTDAGATASDVCDTSVEVATSGSVDTTTPGTYTLTYSATDASNNAATEKARTVVVEEAPEENDPVVTVNTNGKYVRVLVDGTVVSRKRVGKKKLRERYRVLKTKRLYPGRSYQTVAYFGVRKKKAKLVVFRLNANNRLKKRVVRTFAIAKGKRPTLKLRSRRKRIIASVVRRTAAQRTYRLTRKGKLRRIR